MKTEARLQRILSVRIRDFRNLQSLDWEPHPRFNVLWGDNGQGKSNLLEAVYAVGALRSFRGSRPAELVRWGSTEAIVSTIIENGPRSIQFALRMSSESGRLTVRIDGKRPASADDYFSSVQMVLFHPGDGDLIRGSPELRRRWLDRLLYQLFPGYADDHRRYLRALRSRNRLLADGAEDAALEAWEGTMAPLAERLVKSRAAAMVPLGAAATVAHSSLVTTDEVLELQYQPSLLGEAGAFLARWAKDRRVDRARQRTGVGPQRDDVTFSLAGRSARTTASQGQQRSVALALKLAEVSVLEGLRRCAPILLLDDVSSELDPRRNEALFQALSVRGAQVFVTTTRREFVLGPEERQNQRISGGMLVSREG